MWRKPTNPVLSGRAANVGLETKAAVRKYPPKSVSSAPRTSSPGCSMEGSGRPYFSSANPGAGSSRRRTIRRRIREAGAQNRDLRSSRRTGDKDLLTFVGVRFRIRHRPEFDTGNAPFLYQDGRPTTMVVPAFAALAAAERFLEHHGLAIVDQQPGSRLRHFAERCSGTGV